MAHGEARPVLDLGAQQTLVLTATTANAPGLPLDIGFSLTAAQCFGHSPPTPSELEAAIMVVEDELCRVPALSARQATVVVPLSFMVALGRAIEGSANVLSLDQVERLFDLLAALSMGRPAASAGIPADPAFAATLLMLRESMHHLKFESVRLEAVADALS